MERENTTLSSNLLDVYNSLRDIEKKIKTQKHKDTGINEFVDMLSKNPYVVSCDKMMLLNAVKLLNKDDMLKIEDMVDNSLMFQSVSELNNEISKNLNNPFVLNSDLKASIHDAENVEERTSQPRKMKRTRSLLKSHSTKAELDTQLYAYHDKAEYFTSSLMPDYQPSIHRADTYTTGLFNIPSIANITNNRSLSRLSPKKRSTLNLYSPNAFDFMMNRKTIKPSLDSKKTLLNVSPLLTVASETNGRGPTSVIKNSILSANEFQRILNESLKNAKNCDHIDFRDNVFSFDVLQFLKDFFSLPLSKLYQIDLRRNKLKIDNRGLEFAKKHLLANNVKVLI